MCQAKRVRIKDLLKKPPTGFVYTDSDTKSVVTGNTFADLVRNVNRHRYLNGLQFFVDQEQMIHDQLCDKLGSEYCEGYGLGDAVHSIANPIAKVMDKFVKTNIKACISCAQRRARLNS